MPINYKDYPDNWKLLRHKILERAGNMCELCFLENGILIVRNKYGMPIFRAIEECRKVVEKWCEENYNSQYKKITKVVLTIHHIDNDKQNNDEKNLIALCQRCHLILHKNRHSKRKKKS